jgi:hypothetical protein
LFALVQVAFVASRGRFQSNVVQAPVNVTEGNGRSVDSHMAYDFELVDDGAQQEVTVGVASIGQRHSLCSAFMGEFRRQNWKWPIVRSETMAPHALTVIACRANCNCRCRTGSP